MAMSRRSTRGIIGLEPGKLMLWMGPDNSLSAPATVTTGKWQFIAATFDGLSVFRLYSDGAQVGQGVLALGRVAPVLQIAPPVPMAVPGMPGFQGQHFGGKVAGFTIVREALSAEKIKQLAGKSSAVFAAGVRGRCETVAGADAGTGGVSGSARSGDVSEEPRAVSGGGGEAGADRAGRSGRWRQPVDSGRGMAHGSGSYGEGGRG